jgi:hypothetical protein
VIIPTAPLNSPFYRMAPRPTTSWSATSTSACAASACWRTCRAERPPFDPEHPPVRLVIRLSADYLLRLAEPLSLHVGDLVTG